MGEVCGVRVYQNKLKDKYRINIAFYVDSDAHKVDNVQVFLPDCLERKSSEYYVVIPLAFYQSVKDIMVKNGYREEKDYYYFSDCALCQEVDYYEDAHKNKIIGKYQGLKFAFSGFQSEIEIGDEVHFQNVSIYVGNDSKIVIGNGVNLIEGSISVNAGGKLDIKDQCSFEHFSIHVGEKSRALIGEKVKVEGESASKVKWLMSCEARLEIGAGGLFESGYIGMFNNSLLKIGKGFQIRNAYDIRIDDYSSILIGNDCLFSREIMMRSNDGHSIFDVMTGENLNSTENISKSRKIEIGNHVWVGMRATILYHTKIEDGCIIGAMSLVKNRFPNNCIIAGIPAKVRRKNVSWSDKNGAENIGECGQEYVNYTIE